MVFSSFPCHSYSTSTSDREDTPSTVIDLGIPLVRAALVDSTSSLLLYQSVPAQLPSPQVATFSNPCCLCHFQQTIFQEGLISQNPRSLHTQEARLVRAIISDAEAMAAAANGVEIREDPIDIDPPARNNPTSCLLTPESIHDPNLPCFQCQLRDHIRKNSLKYCCL